MTTIEVNIAPGLTQCHRFNQTGTQYFEGDDDSGGPGVSLEVTFTIQGRANGSTYRYNRANYTPLKYSYDIFSPEVLPC